MLSDKTEQKLTFKDLKNLFKYNAKVEINHARKVIFELCLHAIPFLKDDINWFMRFIENESKLSLDKRDEYGLLKGNVLQWHQKYLIQEQEDQRQKRIFKFLIRKWMLKHDAPDDQEIEPFTIEAFAKDIRTLLSWVSDNVEDQLEKNYHEIANQLMSPSDKETLRIKSWLENSFVKVLNSVSLIQNKATISELLQQALNENKPENFKKIFLVDPSVYHMKEVQDYIFHSDDLAISAQIATYYSNSIQKPFVSNSKNQISQKPLFLIGLMDSMGLVHGQFHLSNTRLLKLATEAGVNHDDIDQQYFNKLLKHIRNN